MVLPNEGFKSSQKTELRELQQRQEPLHLIWLVYKYKPSLEQGFAGCIGVHQADRAENRMCKAHTSESSAGDRE